MAASPRTPTPELRPVRFALLCRHGPPRAGVDAQKAALRAALVAASGGDAPQASEYPDDVLLVCVTAGVAVKTVAAAHGFRVFGGHVKEVPSVAFRGCFRAADGIDGGGYGLRTVHGEPTLPASAGRRVCFAVLHLQSPWTDAGSQKAALRAALVAASGGDAPQASEYPDDVQLVCVPEGVQLEALAAGCGFRVTESFAAEVPSVAFRGCFKAMVVRDAEVDMPFALRAG